MGGSGEAEVELVGPLYMEAIFICQRRIKKSLFLRKSVTDGRTDRRTDGRTDGH